MPLSAGVCPDCGAAVPTDTCEERWHALLALDHSRQAPWGPLHGLAFATYTLQHARSAPPRTIARALDALRRIVDGGEDPGAVFASYRTRSTRDIRVPSDATPRPLHFRITIHDLGDFNASTYGADLMRWAGVTLRAWDGSWRASRASTRKWR